jgi:putative transposase
MPDSPPRLDFVFQKYDSPLYFVTFNTYRRRQLLANHAVAARLREFANEGVGRGIVIGRYVIMPDHIHLFARGTSHYPLTQWMRLLKRSLSKAISKTSPH